MKRHTRKSFLDVHTRPLLGAHSRLVRTPALLGTRPHCLPIRAALALVLVAPRRHPRAATFHVVARVPRVCAVLLPSTEDRHRARGSGDAGDPEGTLTLWTSGARWARADIVVDTLDINCLRERISLLRKRVALFLYEMFGKQHCSILVSLTYNLRQYKRQL